tara:strand:+ start:582 stop:2354 length:1773 start_codon:yes stop_codon:yes gene_type:complete
MTYNWYDTRASTWYEGYGPGGGPSSGNAGSFVNLSTLTAGTDDYNKALDAVTNNIIGLFEQKGITAAQAPTQTVTVNGKIMTYDDLINQAKSGDTKGAFQSAAAAVTSAADRGDLWGADVSEGGMAMKGKSFLTSGVTDTTTIQDLYTQGFGDEVGEIDAEGLKYWEDRLAGTSADGIQMSIQEIAASFAASDEAQLRDAYHEQYGRDADDAGLDYWLSQDESVTGISDVQNFLNAVTYKGEDQDGDGIVSAEEKLTSKYMVQGETLVRDDLQNILGQVSNQANKANNPFYTAANNATVQQYLDHINATRTDGMIDQTTGERIDGVGVKGADYDNALFTNTHIGYKGLTQDALNQGDVDDFGDNATGMGRFGTVAEQKAYMDAHMGGDSGDLAAAQASGVFGRSKADARNYGQGVFSDVMDKTWGALTDEKVKTLGDYVPWDVFKPDGHKLTRKDAGNLLMEQNWDHWKGQMSSKPETPKGTTPLDWSIVPEKPDVPTPLPVDRKDINYMPNVSSDVQDTSGYGAAKTQFDQAVTAAAPDIRTAQGQAGQRFTGTSAKGVRMKRSKASRMGTIRGTKQLGREQQTKSLNI